MSTTDFNPMPSNAESCLRSCSETFAQLAALLAVIKEKAPECSDIANLAALGWSAACEMGDFADSVHAELLKSRDVR